MGEGLILSGREGKIIRNRREGGGAPLRLEHSFATPGEGGPSLRNYHAAVRDVGLWERKWQMCVKDLGWPPTQINLLGANYDSKFL